jgi:flagellar basal-body rod protein FlgG
MLKEIYEAGLGMLNQQTRLEVTANNIANANTTGFKRAAVFERNLIDARANFYNVPGNTEQNDSPVGSYYDFSNGSFEKTANPLDLAIEGNGYFVVQDNQGKEFLTRAGNFRLSDDGTIVTMDGKKLMGTEGELNVSKEFFSKYQITNDNRELGIRIAESGEVFVNDYEVGKVRVENVVDEKTLQRISNQDFIATEGTELNSTSGEDFKIRQGWVENSNVNIVNEMVQMIELQRMFEAGSKVIQTNDNTLDKSIALGRYY